MRKRWQSLERAWCQGIWGTSKAEMSQAALATCSLSRPPSLAQSQAWSRGARPPPAPLPTSLPPRLCLWLSVASRGLSCPAPGTLTLDCRQGLVLLPWVWDTEAESSMTTPLAMWPCRGCWRRQVRGQVSTVAPLSLLGPDPFLPEKQMLLVFTSSALTIPVTCWRRLCHPTAGGKYQNMAVLGSSP